jgi:hypothetical protein
MDLQASNVVEPADVLPFDVPAVDIASDGPAALVHLAIGILRVTAIAGLMSPLLLVVWIFS